MKIVKPFIVTIIGEILDMAESAGQTFMKAVGLFSREGLHD